MKFQLITLVVTALLARRSLRRTYVDGDFEKLVKDEAAWNELDDKIKEELAKSFGSEETYEGVRSHFEDGIAT